MCVWPVCPGTIRSAASGHCRMPLRVTGSSCLSGRQRSNRAPIVLIQYPFTEPLKVTWHDHGFVRLAAEGRELQHRAGTSPGAAGAPIFDGGLKLIGMHNGNLGGWRNVGLKRGTLIAPILEWLRNRGTLGVATGETAL